MKAVAAVIEFDVERDRKECVALDLKVTGANRELAQWLVDHPRYSNRIVADWIGCHHSRIHYLRKWANGGFIAAPFGYENHPDKRQGGVELRQTPLKSLDNSRSGVGEAFDDDLTPPSYLGYDEADLAELANRDAKERLSEVAEPKEIEENVLHTVQRSVAVAAATQRILKVSSLDRKAKDRISKAIERLIAKWRSTQKNLMKG